MWQSDISGKLKEKTARQKNLADGQNNENKQHEKNHRAPTLSNFLHPSSGA